MTGGIGSSPAPQRSYSRIRFGAFEADLSSRELRKGSARIRVPEQAFLILQLLVEKQGEIVTREELQTRLWQADTYVDFDHGLNVMVSRLRDAISDSAKNPRFIETVPRRGYRFLATVEYAHQQLTSMPVPQSTAAPPQPDSRAATSLLPAQAIESRTKPGQPKALLAAMAILGLAILGVLLASRRSAVADQAVFPATTFTGSKDFPSISSTGRQIAFVWAGPAMPSTGNRSLYVKSVDSNEPLRLTSSGHAESQPAFSPDDTEIAFLRREPTGQFAYVVPAQGGVERKICAAGPGLAWSPDGAWFALASPADSANRSFILLHNLKSGQQIRLTNPEPASDSFPAISPNGKRVAFVRSYSLSAREVMVVPVSGGTAKRLTFDSSAIWGLAWTADGRDIVYSANRGGGEALWRVPADGGAPSRIPVTPHNAFYPSISRNGGRLVYTEVYSDTNIYVRSLPGGESKLVVSSTREDHSPQFSPDGERIVYVSKRSGSDEIWMTQRDGSKQFRLTNFDGPATGTPRWSPDGRWLAFDSRASGHQGIYLMKAEGGDPYLLTTSKFDERLPAWSRDGEWIYFCRQAGARGQLYKRPVAGGEAIRLTVGSGEESFEGPDGKYLYFARGPSIWRVSTDGRADDQPVAELSAGAFWRYWGTTSKGLFFLPDMDGAARTIRLLNLRTGEFSPVATIDNRLLSHAAGASLSPDGRWLAHVQLDHMANDLMIIDHFR